MFSIKGFIKIVSLKSYESYEGGANSTYTGYTITWYLYDLSYMMK